MFICCEGPLFIIGLIVLIAGKFRLYGKRTIQGTRARIVGLFLMLPGSISLLLIMVHRVTGAEVASAFFVFESLMLVAAFVIALVATLTAPEVPTVTQFSPSTSIPASASSSLAEDFAKGLEKLKEMLDAGLITTQEYEAKKKEGFQAKVMKIIEKELRVDASKITLESDFRDDLKVKFIDFVGLIMAFEEEFNIEISDEERDKISTVGEAVEFLYSRSRLFDSEGDTEVFRMSQMQLLEFIARMGAEGVSLENDVNKAAAMFAITGLGYFLPNNAHVIDNKQYEVGMEGEQIVVKFPKGVLKK